MIVNGQKDQLRNLKTLVSTRKARLEEHNNKPTYMIYENKTFTIYDIENNIVNYSNVK